MASCSCIKCGKTMDENNFYTYKNGEKTELCKKCMTLHVDNFNPDTFLWLLEKMDVPYLPEEWNVLRDKAYAKDPYKMNGMSVFGKYLSKMKLKQWIDPDTGKLYGYADVEKIRARQGWNNRPTNNIDIEGQQKALQEAFDAGKITEAEYKTMMNTEIQHAAMPAMAPPPTYIGANNPFNENNFMSEDELTDPASELTADDKLFLAMKWGRLYKPNEWIELEKKYNEMMNSFDIQDSDTTGTLILICKTYLKMNQAIDCGDMDGFQKLSRVYDSLRKSAKFTAAQNKEDKNDFVDSIGEFVAMCEREEGFIPRYATDIPQDKVDLTLKDMNNYLYKLVTQDLGFGQQIEDSLKKIQIQKEMNEAEAQTSLDEMDAQELVDKNYEEFYESVAAQKAQDEEMLFEESEDKN